MESLWLGIRQVVLCLRFDWSWQSWGYELCEGGRKRVTVTTAELEKFTSLLVSDSYLEAIPCLWTFTTRCLAGGDAEGLCRHANWPLERWIKYISSAPPWFEKISLRSKKCWPKINLHSHLIDKANRLVSGNVNVAFIVTRKSAGRARFLQVNAWKPRVIFDRTIRTLTCNFCVLAPWIKSRHTFSKERTFLEVKVMRIRCVVDESTWGFSMSFPTAAWNKNCWG